MPPSSKTPTPSRPASPAYFRQNGYTTVSVGKVSHHPGGRGGPDWDDDSKPEMPLSWDRHLLPAGPWQHPRGAMHGLANGEIRENAKSMDVFQSFDGPDTVYPDGLITDESIAQLDPAREGQKALLPRRRHHPPPPPVRRPRQIMEPYNDATLPPIPAP